MRAPAVLLLAEKMVRRCIIISTAFLLTVVHCRPVGIYCFIRHNGRHCICGIKTNQKAVTHHKKRGNPCDRCKARCRGLAFPSRGMTSTTLNEWHFTSLKHALYMLTHSSSTVPASSTMRTFMFSTYSSKAIPPMSHLRGGDQ